MFFCQVRVYYTLTTLMITFMHCLAMGICSEKCIIRRFHCFVNITEYKHNPRHKLATCNTLFHCKHASVE